MIENAEQAGRYLDDLIDRERAGARSGARSRFDLAAIHALLAAADHPERELAVIHVAGSKGKGSVCLFAEALLRALGERTGTFTSPHLERWTERFRIDGREIGDRALAMAVDRLRPHIDQLRTGAPGAQPSFFDATTAAALVAFREARVDRVLLEVGLGGRLDSTNAVDAQVACITSIELEHTELLGSTLAEVAAEKAGILSPDVPAVVGRLPAQAMTAVVAHAQRVGAPLRCEGEAFRADVALRAGGGTRLRYAETAGFALEVDLDLPGRHQAHNAALAIACVRALDAHPQAAVADAVGRAFAGLRLPARVEVVRRAPPLVVDAAHTPASAGALAEALACLTPERFDFVVSISRDKDVDSIVTALLPHARRFVVTRADADRSLVPGRVAGAIARAGAGVPVEIVDDPRRAIAAALASGRPLCIAGSFYLAGIARALVAQASHG